MKYNHERVLVIDFHLTHEDTNSTKRNKQCLQFRGKSNIECRQLVDADVPEANQCRLRQCLKYEATNRMVKLAACAKSDGDSSPM